MWYTCLSTSCELCRIMYLWRVTLPYVSLSTIHNNWFMLKHSLLPYVCIIMSKQSYTNCSLIFSIVNHTIQSLYSVVHRILNFTGRHDKICVQTLRGVKRGNFSIIYLIYKWPFDSSYQLSIYLSVEAVRIPSSPALIVRWSAEVGNPTRSLPSIYETTIEPEEERLPDKGKGSMLLWSGILNPFITGIISG